MKINELLKPNEGFNLNEAQVAGNRCCLHIHNGAGFRALLLPPPHIQPHHHLLPPSPVALPLVFTHAFPGVTVSPGLADGNVPFFSRVFIGWGEHGKRSWGILCGPTPSRGPPPPTPSSPPKPALPHVTPSAPDMRGKYDVRNMGLDLCSLVSWEEL